MESYNTLKPYLNKQIEDWGGYTSPDYKTFQTKYRNFLKKICKANGYELVRFNPNHYEFSCFIQGNGKYVYISISDVRYFSKEWFNNILIRTAQNEKDYHGGPNNYTSLPNLENKVKAMLMGE